jgi:hypothetical protein
LEIPFSAVNHGLAGRITPDKSSSRNVALGCHGADSHFPRTPFIRTWQSVPPRSKENVELRVLIDARLRTGKSRPGNDVSDITSWHVPESQMRDVTESLMMLCEQASKEQDSEKLSNLVEEIILLLAERQRLEEMETLRDTSRPN